MLHVKFQCETYGANVILYSNASGEQVSKNVIKRYGCKVDCSKDDAAAFFVLESKKEGVPTQYLVWVRDPQAIDILAHECIHLAVRVLYDRGINITVKNDEPLAYYHNYLFRTLWNEMLCYNERRAKRGSKKK
jgi:hypothetical protein